jgi:hypothetical protein
MVRGFNLNLHKYQILMRVREFMLTGLASAAILRPFPGKVLLSCRSCSISDHPENYTTLRRYLEIWKYKLSIHPFAILNPRLLF